MTLERKTTALEFETMLRRHLRRGGAPVSACAGFDPDRASSYLEGGLGGNARARYEAHLAGCPACRRHVIELSRLSQLALQPEAIPVVPARWSRWRSSLADRIDHWVDPSSWRLNWPVASTVLAGCAVLTLVMIARPWRQFTLNDSRVSIEILQRTPDSSAALQAPSASPTVENFEINSSVLAEEKSRESQSLRAASAAARSSDEHAQGDRVSEHSKPEPTIPKPRIMFSPEHKSSDAEKMELADRDASAVESLEGIGGLARNDRILRDKQEYRALGNPEPGSPPSVRRSARAAAEFTQSARRTTSAPTAGAIAENRQQMRDEQSPTSMALPRMTPNPEYNPVQSGLREKEIPKAKNEKSSLHSQKASIWAYVMDYMKGYIPWRRTENFERSLVIGKDARKDSDNKASDNKANENNANNASNANNANNANKDSGVGKADKGLIRHLRGKTFRFVRGVWIDDQYDAEMSGWRLTLLRRGSEAYNRVLADEPQLKEFFDFGPIIIVWQDKIYRVTGK
jgi:Putative zinc-finger